MDAIELVAKLRAANDKLALDVDNAKIRQQMALDILIMMLAVLLGKD